MKNKFKFPFILVAIIALCTIAIIALSSNSYPQESITPINNREYYSAAKTAFAEAKEEILIVFYGAKHYESPLDDNTQVNDLISELGYAVSRGVKVKVLFDQEWNNIAETAIHFKSLGIDVEFDSKDTRTHSKFIVIDGKLVIIGSTNWSYHALQLNNEANVLISSKDIAEQYEDHFWDIWKK